MSNYAMSAVAELAPVEPAIQAQAAPDANSLRAQFHEESQAARRMAARPGLYIAVIIYLLFAATDILLVPDVAAYTIAARFAVGAAALVTLETLLRFGAATKWLDITCAGAIILGYLGWLLPTAASSNHESVSYYMVFGTIFMMSANLFFTFQFSFSVVTSTIILLILYAVNYFVPSTLTYKLVFGAFYISCFVFTSYINWKLNRERYNVFLNALEARNQHREATERGKALLKLSRTDPLTGLENRRAVDERLRDLWSNWQRHGATFAVLLIDVDFFKRFNDYYGHQKGDRCLMEVADSLRHLVERRSASIGRYGGEEFIVLAQAKNHEEVIALAEEIRSEVEALAITHNERRDGTQVVTVSIGAAFTRDEAGTKLEKIIQEADRALYLAKADGRNCVHLFDPNDPQTSDESENVAALLKIAIERDLVSLVFQPIANMRSGRIEAMEALMRLTMPDGTAVPPSLFIPVAERTGMILELGRWAIRTACRELMSSEHIRTISVNVSPVQLKAPGFAASVAAALGEAGVTGDRLALEITEGLEMEMHSDVLRCISDLKLLGIKVWLDDFGTGFAGLSWLRLIDFDTVKIDRSFLHDCVTPRGRAMFRDIVGLLRNRGPKILVEGVESEEQLELLRKLDIDHAQGYHIGRPAPAERIRALFEEPKRQRTA
ncbi:putative bifunctional diguanylate cyclase/phosphodiesterase [Mesorhizobium sp. UC22_110]|jgi:diguanylate cyclase (GGDEF)-like protein|uniref:putative bifunctional diguanylate cyclase/phosphodiesterase n=1 Tax=unclassified Mesorhizobium TaxID=325217 RepID=UPI00366F94FB